MLSKPGSARYGFSARHNPAILDHVEVHRGPHIDQSLVRRAEPDTRVDPLVRLRPAACELEARLVQLVATVEALLSLLTRC
jgi:hypothetical protein